MNWIKYCFLLISLLASVYAFADSPSDLEAAHSTIDTEVSSDEVSSIEMTITADSEENRSLILDWLRQYQTTTNHGANTTRGSVIEIGVDTLDSSGNTLKSKFEDYALSNWDQFGRCSNTSPDEMQKAFEALLKDMPEIIAQAAGESLQTEYNSLDDLVNIPLFFVRPFVENDQLQLNETQTAVAIGTVTAAAVTASSLYLRQNEVDFSEKFKIPTSSINLNELSLNIAGENIGFNSDNPYLRLGTTIEFENNTSFSISAGASRVTSSKAKGKETIDLGVDLPIFESDHSLQSLKMYAGASSIHLGPRDRNVYTGGSYKGEIIYSLTPRFDLEKNPALSDLRLNLKVSPLAVSGSMMLDPETGRPQDQLTSSIARASFGYSFNTPTSSANLSVGAKGGVSYMHDGTISPIYGGFFSLIIKPNQKK